MAGKAGSMSSSMRRLLAAATVLKEFEEQGYMLFSVTLDGARRCPWICDKIDMAVDEFRDAVDEAAKAKAEAGEAGDG